MKELDQGFLVDQALSHGSPRDGHRDPGGKQVPLLPVHSQEKPGWGRLSPALFSGNPWGREHSRNLEAAPRLQTTCSFLYAMPLPLTVIRNRCLRMKGRARRKRGRKGSQIYGSVRAHAFLCLFSITTHDKPSLFHHRHS